MGMCFNRRVLIGLGIAAVALFAVSPRLLGSAAPLLIMAACPLSMIVMMRAMGRERTDAPSAPLASETSDSDARLRELEEEVNRLRAESRLEGRQPSR